MRPMHLLADNKTDVWVSTDLRFFGYIRNPCAIFFIYILLATFVLFHYGGTTPGGEPNGIPDGLTSAWVIFFILFDLFFIISNFQAVLFHCLLCQIPCVYCFVCFCTNAGNPANEASIRYFER